MKMITTELTIKTYDQFSQRQRQVRGSPSTSRTSTLRDFEKRRHNIVDELHSNNQNMKHDHRKSAVSGTSGKNFDKQMDCKKTYLFLYNLTMFIMFLRVYIVLIKKYLDGDMDDEKLQDAAFIVKMLTYTQLLETLHPILGLVPGGPFMPFLQVIGRIVVNFFLTEREIRLDTEPYAHYLFIVWSSIEIIRYSLFIPLYPMGGFFESMVVLSTIKQYGKTGEYSLSLPNQTNFSFNLPLFLRIYIFLLLGPSICFLMKYMWSQRAKQLKIKED